MKILAYDYKVIGLSNPLDDLAYMGRHDSQELTIKLCSSMSEQHLQSTVLHEILEGISWQLHMKLEEKQIIDLEIGLYATLIENGVDLSPLLKELERDVPSRL